MIIKTKRFAIASGYVPSDADYKTVGANGTPRCSFSIKVDEDGKGDDKVTTWQNVTAWRDIADAAKYIRKGDYVLVSGLIREYTYTNRDGEEKEGNEIVADFVQVQSRPMPTTITAERFVKKRTVTSDFEEIVGDDDLPF